jgi:hypothetical protein
MRLVTEEELSYVMKKGDEVSELVTSGNLNFVYIEDYKEASREVAQDALEEFNFFGDDITKEGKEQQDTDNCGVTIASESKSKGSTCYSRNSGGNLSDGTNNVVDDTTTDEADSDYQDTPIRKGAKYQFKTNLFEGEIRSMKKQHKSIIQVQESVDEADDESVDTFIKWTIKQHKMYRKPKASKTTLCEKRASMELIASKYQKKQGEQISKKHAVAENYKHILQIGDIGAIHVPPNVRGATDFPFLPIMVTDTIMSKPSRMVRYAICTQHRHLEGVYNRDMIEHEQQ